MLSKIQIIFEFSDNYSMKNFQLRKSSKVFAVFFLMFFYVGVGFAEVYCKNAIVSYYADDFHGKKTSNGEIFNMNDYTCASKELPFETVLKITNLANNKTVQVRVNDRGPFVPDRVLDLSKAAAKKLDMIKSGTAHVKIEIVKMGKNTKASVQTAEKAKKIMEQRYGKKVNTNTKNNSDKPVVVKTSTKKIEPNKTWDVQLGAYSTRENANKLAQQLLKEGFKEVVFQKSEGIYRVVIRNVPSKEIEILEGRLIKNGHTEYTIRERKLLER